ncbi:MAG: S8 family serine peptidase [Bdellovibrionales bacterium]
MKMQRLSALAITVLMAACGQAHKDQRRHQAPTGAHDVGVLVDSLSPADLAHLQAQFPEAKIRHLSPEHGLYEFFDVSESDLKPFVPNSSIQKNRFYEFKKFSEPVPAGLEVKGLDKCVTVTKFPKAVLTVVQPAVKSTVFTVELGESVKLSSQNSQPHMFFPSELKSAFVVVPPSNPAGGGVALGKAIEFKPQALGAYRIFLIVQDSRGACAMEEAALQVTVNRPYDPPPNPPSLDLAKFNHLKMVKAPEAWKLSEGQGITIAVLDTGIQYNHPYLASGINGGDSARPLGWDFVNDDAFPYDDDGHGSHVAGLAAGRQFGIARKSNILPIKVLNSIGGDAGSFAAGILYAVDHGAKVINISAGGASPQPHPMLVKAVQYAEQHDVLVVAAAGNGDPMSGLGFNLDMIPIYPAALTQSNVLTVGASDSINPLAPYSNFGAKSVDVVTPGGLAPDDLLTSAAMENTTGEVFAGMSGTSMASPIAAGIAALVWSAHPNLTLKQVKQTLIDAGTRDHDLEGITVSGRKLDALTAVEPPSSTSLSF